MQVYQRKLTIRKVIQMRTARRRDGLTYEQLAERFGVSRTSASRACQGTTWAHVPGALCNSMRGLGGNISDDDVFQMRQMRRMGSSFADIARKFNTAVSHVAKICRGQSRYGIGGYIDLDGASKRCKGCGFVCWDEYCTECKKRGAR